MTPTDPDTHRIAGAGISAAVKAHGAELCSLRDATGRELLWQAGPVWPRHAPVLFPVVGRLRGDTLRVDDREYRMGQHGFARDARFAWAARDAGSCRLSLADSAETRTHYPFPFRFEIAFTCADDALRITYVIGNPGDAPLPVSAGAHPAFRWPLMEGIPREAHVLRFEQPEPAPIRRLTDGLLQPDPHPTPIQGRDLPLRDALFAPDAIILDRPVSRSVTYGAPGTPAITVAWDGFAQLGIWSRAGGDFLCIEPWRGFADPLDFVGPFTDKPGLMHIPPGGEQRLSLRVRVGAATG